MKNAKFAYNRSGAFLDFSKISTQNFGWVGYIWRGIFVVMETYPGGGVLRDGGFYEERVRRTTLGYLENQS